MSVTYKILTDIGLVYVRHDGFADIATNQASAMECAADPAFRPDMRHLFDMSRATGYETNFAAFFEMQAKLAEIYQANTVEHFVVFYAPDRVPREMAEMARKSWDGVGNMTMIILDDFDRVLDVIGLSQSDFDRLLSDA